MKRTLICVASIFLVSGALEASSVIACSGSATAVNSCYASHLSDFDSNLQWDTLTATNPSAPTTENGNIYNTTWYGTTGFMNVTVTGTELRLADNYGLVWTGSAWVNPLTFPGYPYRFSGNFDAPPDTTPSSAVTPGSPGDHLLGSASNTASFLIGTSSTLDVIGFRVAAVTMSTFDLTLSLFASSDGSGTPEILSVPGLTGGGNCPGLFNNPPTPCNTAAYVEVITSGPIRSFSVNTNDPSGFYIDTLQVSAPEPSPMLLTGIGLLAGALVLRRKQGGRAATNH